VVTLPGGSPEAVLDLVRAREEALHSLRARFESQTTLPDGGHRQADGVLLVRKPDCFRMRLLMPFGLTVFDLVARGDRVWVSLPMGGGDRQARAEAPFSHQDLREIFLRGEAAFPGQCTAVAQAKETVAVTCRDRNGMTLRTLQLDAARGVIESETSFASGRPQLTVEYAEYRRTGGALLPFRIALRYPQRGIAVDIEVQRYEVNPQLPDALFEPPPGAQSQQ
jgi:outer membrane lipoprotein-sorting protein